MNMIVSFSSSRLRGINAILAAAIVLSPFSFAPLAHGQSKPRLAFVTRAVPAPDADQFFMKRLAKKGWNVTPVDDDKVRASGRRAIAGYDLVVISSSVYPDRIQGRLRSAPEPIVVAENRLYPAFGMSDKSNRDRGMTRASKKIKIVNPINLLAAGFAGQVYVSTNAKSMNFGKPGPDAYVIATAADSDDQAVIFAYEAGGQLVDGKNASGPRVGFYMGQSHSRLNNRDGWALFDAAASWATPKAPEGAPSGTFAKESAAPLAKSIMPKRGTLLGANVSKEKTSSRYNSVLGFEKQIGRKLNILNRFHEFSSGITSDFYWDRKHIKDGRTLLISWRATDNAGIRRGKPDPLRARKIVAGKYDRQIKAMAVALRDLRAPVLLRFNWEMDQNRGDPQYIGTPKEFIAAWRYVYKKFESIGAKNVQWVWAPRARSFAKGIGQKFYPGYEYVDWVGGSSVPINSFTSPRTIFGSWNQWAANIGKPQLLWIGLRENKRDSGWKARFINELRYLATGQWSGLKAIVYYNSNSPLGHDYTIDTSRSSLSAFRNLARDVR